MSTPKNVRSTRVGLTFARLGTFWTNVFKDKKQVRRLINMVHQTPALQSFEATSNNLGGVRDEKDRIANVVVSYDKRDVVQGGDQFFDDDRLLYGTLEDYPGVYGGGNTKFWILPITNYVPFAIQAPTRRLLVGIDFFIYKDRWIFFRNNPELTFEGERFLIVSGRRRQPWLLEYATRTSPPDTMQHVVEYARNNQSPGAFELALASVAGMRVLNFDQHLLVVQEEGTTTTYTFEKEIVRVTYPHTPLEVGKLYNKNHIIGDGVRVYPGGPTSPAWWRAVDWRGGLSLDPIVDFKGLFLKDEDVTAYAAGTDPGSVEGSKVHGRMDLTGNSDLEKPYWDKVSARETDQGYYLNSVLRLLTEQQALSVRIEEPGSGYSVDDLIVLAGGTFATPITLKVTSVNGGAITGVSIYAAGAYTVTPEDPVAQASGAGTDATFSILWEYVADPYAALVEQMVLTNTVNTLLHYPREQLNPRRLPYTKLVNPIDIFFLAVLNPRCVVITLDQSVIPADRQAELFRYLARELPLGVLSIVFCYAPGLPEDTFSLADSTELVSIVDFDAADLHAPEESFDLGGSIDFVTITQEA